MGIGLGLDGGQGRVMAEGVGGGERKGQGKREGNGKKVHVRAMPLERPAA